MELGQLRYFIKIVEHRSFTKAAQDCSVSQPALSQQISKLEKELGQPLFERQGRTIRLTSAGQWLHLKAGKILQLAEDAKKQITDNGETGLISISAIPTVAPYLLPIILNRAVTLFPKAEFVISEDTTDVLIKRCSNGEVDIGILALPASSKFLTIEPLFTEQLLLAMSPENPLSRKENLVESDFLDQSFLLLRDAHCLVEAIEGFCDSEHFQRPMSSQIEQLTTIQSLVSMNLGVSLVPEMASGIDLSGNIIYRSLQANPSWPRPSRTIAICFNPQRYQSKLLGSLITAVNNLCVEGFSPKDLMRRHKPASSSQRLSPNLHRARDSTKT